MTTARKSHRSVSPFGAEYVPEQAHETLTPGEAVRIARELNDLTQNELAARAGIPQPAISAIETGAVALGADRAERLGGILNVHPGVLLFPSWRAAGAYDAAAIAARKAGIGVAEKLGRQYEPRAAPRKTAVKRPPRASPKGTSR